MSFKDKFQDKILGWLPEDKIRVQMAKNDNSRKGGSKKSPTEIKRQPKAFEVKTLKDWKDAVAVATDPAAVNRRLVVGGPEALRGEQTAAALGRAWGRPIRFESLPVAQFARQMGQLFAPDDPATAARIERDLAAVYRWYNESVPSPFTVDMREFLSRYSLELQTVETWAKAHPLSQEYIPTGGARHPQSAGQAS